MNYSQKSAVFSGCRQYRYSLFRSWADMFDEYPRQILYILLNPSTADEKQDDPTIRRCVGFAKREGFQSMKLLNIFALRSTDPRTLKGHPDPVGPANDETLRQAVAKAEKTIIAWGTHGLVNDRHSQVIAMLKDYDLYCFGKTEAGLPKHPLYLSKDSNLIKF